MSQDLILSFTKKDWSRTPPTIVHECGPEMCMVSYQKAPLTDDEKSKLGKLARVKMKADSGDKPAQRQWKEITLKLAILRSRAEKGDPRARHTLGILEDSGLFGHVQKISGSLSGSDQDIIEKRIQKAGYNSGWPVYISTSQYAEYKNQASKGNKLAAETLSLLDDNIKARKLKIGDEKKSDLSRYPIGNESSIQGKKQLAEDEIMSIREINPDELAAARDGGSCEQAAMSRTQGIVISDREIKDAMRGSISLLGQGSYPRQRRRRHHRRHYMAPGQVPGQYSSQYPGQVPGQYSSQYPSQSASTYVASRDARKSRIVRRLYKRIKKEHINWMINQDRQNGIYNQTADKYEQAARAWARDQLQQQQLPTRLSASGTNQWQQPVSWFQAQAQAVLNNSTGQRATQITASASPASYPVSYPTPASYPAPSPAAYPVANAYYPASSSYQAPGTSDDPAIYDDDQQGWPSPLLMHGDFVGDEARAEGENSSSCGLGLPHDEYRALVMKQAIRNAGGKRPDTKQLFAAKKAVDNALGTSGVSIYIPGAGPRRRTV